MNEIKNIAMSKDKKEYKNWRKSVTKDNKTKSVEVKECENGFIICINEEDNSEGKWEHEEKKYISTTNPLEGELEVDKDKEAKEEWKEALEALGL